MYLHARYQFMITLYHYSLVLAQASFDHDLVADLRAGLHETLLGDIVPTDDIYERTSFLDRERFPGNDDRTLSDIQQELHFRELSGQ